MSQGGPAERTVRRIGNMQVLNPRVLEVSWDQPAYFLGDDAELTIESFELTQTELELLSDLEIYPIITGA
jgi:hypothetical protein